MPPQTVSLRPQTSHQARRAYQKSGGVLRLSEVEKRRLERSAELEERAAKIRAHNARARERKKKKAEKLEKERETRKRMGMSEPTKVKINASQRSLGAFVETKPKAKVEVIKSPKTQVKEEAAEKALCTTYHVSNTKPLEQLESKGQPFQKCKVEPPLHGSIPLQSRPPIPKVNKANSAILMPPPRSRAPLRKTPGNMRSQPRPRSQKVALNTTIENDWDSLFVSNTQVEREISGCKEDPCAQYTLPQITPAASINSPAPPAVPSDLLADISTQDLQYSSSPPCPAKDVSAQAPNLPKEKKNQFVPSSSHKSNESTVATQKRWPKSLLRGNELATLWYAIHGLYNVDLSIPEIKRLISGKYLTGVGGMIPPRVVTLMAIKIEEERLNGEPPSVPNEIMQWATSMRQREVLEERQAATARARKNPFASKTAISNPKFARQNPGATGPNPVSTKKGLTASKSFDEFDDFDISVDDLRELDV